MSNPSTPPGHYFTSDPSTPSRRRTIEVQLHDVQFELHTDSGVFSPDHLDTGTKYLLQRLPELPPGPFLDVGCGYGPIALTLAHRYPDSAVWATDVNERALALTRENAQRLNVKLNACTPPELPSDLAFGAIVSNPPIRIGKAALHELLETALGQLRRPDGECYLVVHKHLGADSLMPWLNQRGYVATKISSHKGFRLIKVTPGSIPPPSEETHAD